MNNDMKVTFADSFGLVGISLKAGKFRKSLEGKIDSFVAKEGDIVLKSKYVI